jgi:medium-chain acyl-[acyl-carrier-protein] hydrolase
MNPAPSTDSSLRIESFRVHSYEVDFSRRMALDALCRRFLEAAWNHAEALGVCYAHLASEGKFWVLSRLLIRIESPPAWGEMVQLRTWPRPSTPLFAMRDFVLTTNTGERLAAGASAWLVLDAHNHRPQRISKTTASIVCPPALRGLDRDPDKLTESVPGPASLETPVRYRDIDVNGHVNSASYVGWLLDSYPLEFHRAWSINSLEINYLGETRSDSIVSVTARQLTGGDFCHSIWKTGGTEVCRAQMRWSPRTAS